jgi:hypothetical protein
MYRTLMSKTCVWLCSAHECACPSKMFLQHWDVDGVYNSSDVCACHATHPGCTEHPHSQDQGSQPPCSTRLPRQACPSPASHTRGCTALAHAEYLAPWSPECKIRIPPTRKAELVRSAHRHMRTYLKRWNIRRRLWKPATTKSESVEDVHLVLI